MDSQYTARADTVEDGIREQNATLLKFLYACPVGLLEIGVDGEICMMNPHAMQVLVPLTKSGVIVNFFTTMENWAPELRNMAAMFPKRQGKVCEGHRVIVHPGTRENDFCPKVLACTLVKLDESRFAVTIVDISAEIARERRLKQAEVWFASLLDDINDFAVLSMDADGRVEQINSSTTRQTGYPAEELLGQAPDCLEIFDPDSAVVTVKEQLACAGRDGWHLSEGWQRKRNGEVYWCQRLIAVRMDVERHNGRIVSGYLMVLRDITRRHADAGQIVDLLRKDHLTGACNRAHFFAVAERELTRSRQAGQSLALIAIDLDHFKRINDTHGHAAGDQVLKSFTAITKPLLRPVDTLARLGGEEFCVLLPNATLVDAIHVAERIRESLAAQTLTSFELRVTASFGCAQAYESTVADLLAHADQALYAAKRAGRDRIEPSLERLLEPICLG